MIYEQKEIRQTQSDCKKYEKKNSKNTLSFFLYKDGRKKKRPEFELERARNNNNNNKIMKSLYSKTN